MDPNVEVTFQILNYIWLVTRW